VKVFIGEYPTYITPFTIAEWILFWKHPDHDAVFELGLKLCGSDENRSWLARLCNWYNNRQQRKIKVSVDRSDSYSAYHTLALIIAPTLIRLKQDKFGSPVTDDADAPENLAGEELMHERWNWILDEMIWAFTQIAEQADPELDEIEAWDARVKNGQRLFGKYYQNLWW
jgi:hypothetical protein